MKTWLLEIILWLLIVVSNYDIASASPSQWLEHAAAVPHY